MYFLHLLDTKIILTMKNIFLISIFSIFSISIYSQEVAHKIGGSAFGTYTNTDYGYLPGLGVSFDYRMEIRDSHFEIKSHLSGEIINNVNSRFAKHGSVKFGVLGEYNIFRFGFVNRYGEKWTPYVGLGANAVYYNSTIHNPNPNEDDLESESGVAFGARTAFGVKYKINRSFILNVTTYIDWDTSNKLDGWQSDANGKDNSAAIMVGVNYRL